MAIGRNQPCRCGSGKKFKHCCGAPARQTAATSQETFRFASQLHQAGQFSKAERLYLNGLSGDPTNAQALQMLGMCQFQSGKAREAVKTFERAIALNPSDAGARFHLGRGLLHAGMPKEALAHLRDVVRIEPHANEGWQWLADAFSQSRFVNNDAAIEADLVQCLARPDIEPAYLAPAGTSLLRADPVFAALLAAPLDAQLPPASFDEDAFRVLARPLFLLLLENTFIPEPDFECLIARIRRAALLEWRTHRGLSNDSHRDVLGAIAHQCFLTEYLHDECADERPIVEQLGKHLEASLANRVPLDDAEMALFAAYRPLATLSGGESLRAWPDTIIGRLVMRQILEPAEVAHIAANLTSLTKIDDGVSRAVQTQYEQNPYPRWLRAPSAEGAAPLADRLRALFPHAGSAATVPARPSMLIAGCGTGRHVAMSAALDPDSRILAIDLSRTSLAYAARRVRESGLANITFAQADILELGQLSQRFDVIQCSGVLHHMHDPLAGWRALTTLLQPNGKMKIGLYSEAARAGVVAARRLIALRGFTAEAEGMRAARKAIFALPPDHPARAVAGSIDFYSLSGCRDLLFHVQEHRFSLPEIANMLTTLRLDFLGFEFEFAATRLAYMREFPDDPAATSLKNWAEFESRHPDAFAAMYQFWVTAAA